MEETIRSLKEAKKKDNEIIESTNRLVEDLKSENFNLLIENKKLKNEIEDLNNKDEVSNKWFADRKEKSAKFIKTLLDYEQSFNILNQVQLDLEKAFEPLRNQNTQLLADKERVDSALKFSHFVSS